MYNLYKDYIEPYWLTLPIALQNAVSMYQPKWQPWNPDKKDIWVRQPPDISIKDQSFLPFFRRDMEFEELVPEFNEWYADEKLTACFVGIRSDESLNRWRTVTGHNRSETFQGKNWTTWNHGSSYNIYPIYDWKTQDIWRYNGKYYKPYNHIYDLMHKAGVSIHQQRLCQPYGADQRKGLWLFHILEPETWSKIIARVNGANSGAEFVQWNGNVSGQMKVTLPEGHTWESFANMLLESLPPRSKEHFQNKIAVFLKWWYDRGYPKGIPDEADLKDEAAKKVPSWRRICKALLRNDYWCKGLSFSQNKANHYEAYLRVMKNRRRKWGIMF
jgi:predicted phosphoadenosine phosphosulfate sulfurtransferase